jgi:hypothetical protein
LEWMCLHDRHASLGELLSAGLRRDPRKRIDMKTLRARLQGIARERLADSTWPLRP